MKKQSKDSYFFETEEWTLFRSLERLKLTVGIPENDFVKMAVKELVDNALDSGNKCEVGMSGADGFYVQDNGDGLPGNNNDIATLFSVRRPLRSTKLLRLPTRGALGNGLRFVVGLIIAYEGSLKVMTRGRILQLNPRFEDGYTEAKEIGVYSEGGTRIEITLPNLDQSDILKWAELAVHLAGKGIQYKGKTSPHWYDSNAFFELIKASPSQLTIAAFLKEFDGCNAKAAEISKTYRGMHISKLDKDNSQLLLSKMKEVAKVVSPLRLGFVGELDDKEAYFKVPWSTKDDIPCVIEAWASRSHKNNITCFVNRTPLAYEIWPTETDRTFFIHGCNLHVTITGTPKFQVSIWINIITPYMSIQSGGKQPNLYPLTEPIEKAVQGVFKILNRKDSEERKQKRQQENPTTQKFAIITNLADAIKKVSDDGRYRYSIRQLYYVMRPIIAQTTSKELQYKYFTDVVASFENTQRKDLTNIYRDERGSLYHPHNNDTIPLGTRAVEKYSQPEWTFNKVLYCEKEGFFEVLRSAKWPERHDCALLTSKGFASRAARDIIDLIGQSAEEITFFCIHDADTEGTLIFQALTEATKARPERRVKVINLGLEPAEGLEMGLEIEHVKRKKKRTPAQYVSEEWKAWFKKNRIELNAMDTPTFINWLDGKMKENASCKLIPPEEIILDEVNNAAHEGLRARLRQNIIKEARIDEQVDKGYKDMLPTLEEKIRDKGELRPLIGERIAKDPVKLWKSPATDCVNEILVDILNSRE